MFFSPVKIKMGDQPTEIMLVSLKLTTLFKNHLSIFLNIYFRESERVQMCTHVRVGTGQRDRICRETAELDMALDLTTLRS